MTMYVVDTGTLIYGPFHSMQEAALFQGAAPGRKVVPLTTPNALTQAQAFDAVNLQPNVRVTIHDAPAKAIEP